MIFGNVCLYYYYNTYYVTKKYKENNIFFFFISSSSKFSFLQFFILPCFSLNFSFFPSLSLSYFLITIFVVRFFYVSLFILFSLYSSRGFFLLVLKVEFLLLQFFLQLLFSPWYSSFLSCFFIVSILVPFSFIAFSLI